MGTEARAALRRTLSMLNAALDGGLDVQRDCVDLLAARVHLDVARFRQLLAESTNHHPSGDAPCASCLGG